MTSDIQSEYFDYFAYGSNMLSRRLRERTPSAFYCDTGYVIGRRLTFDKKSKDESGKCDIESTNNPNDRVYGVIYKIKHPEKAALDRHEGLGHGYVEEMVDVITSTGVCNANAYVATDKDPNILPYNWYKEIVISGAIEHELPHEYVEWLKTVDSKYDNDTTRRTDNEKLLVQTDICVHSHE